MSGRTRRRWGIVLTVAGLVLAVAGGSWWWGTQEPDVPERATPSPEADTTVVAGTRLPLAVKTPRQPGDPLRLLIPELEVDSRIVPILAPGGVLTPPADPQSTGWWADGARPGAKVGSALVTGHTVSSGGGALDDLEELDRGDTIRVRSDRVRTTYRVTSVEILGKGDLAEQAEELFSQDVPGRLVVVTCEDWNGEVYLSNVVVTATPVGSR